jgi:hypothetical protein
MLFKNNLEHGVSSESWNRAGHVGSGGERHDSNHCEASVVQFPVLFDLQNSGIDSGEVDRGEDDSGQFSSFGVVDSVGLTDNLSKKDHSNDLLLACNKNIK